MNINRRLLTGIILVTLLVAGVFAFAAARNDGDQPTSEDTAQNQGETPSENDDNPTQNEENNSEAEDEQEQSDNKTSTPTKRVSEKPEIYTAFGHIESNPLKNGQNTSTTCTTEPNTDCTISFNSGSQTIDFETKRSDSEGVAFWSWVGGEDVPSGTWSVTAKAGDKTSDAETIYIQ